MLPAWREDPDLSHGWIAPLLALLLVHESRTRGTPRFFQGKGANAFLVACFTLGVATLSFAGLMAAALSWDNDLTRFLLSLALTTLFVGIWLFGAHPRLRWVPLNWAGAVACVLPVLSAPLPPGTYHRLSLSLQLFISRSVVETLHLLGIPARQAGNVIELSTSVVGVEEACSGIRSLTSCLVAALFFSAVFLRRAGPRVLLLACVVPIAFGMNFVRSLALTLMADRGIEIGGWIHDSTGYLSLVASAVLLGFTAKLLATLETPASVPPPPSSTETLSVSVRIFTAGSALATAITLFFVVKTQPLSAEIASPTAIESLLPETFPGWHTQTDPDLYRFRTTLKTDALLQRTYSRLSAEGEVEQITVYLARWAPGQASVSLVASHTPDACWPGAGWNNATPRSALPEATPSNAFPPGDYRCFSREDQIQHVWYWHLHRGRIVTDSDPFSPWRMARLVLTHGITSKADQTFIRISSNRPLNQTENENLLQEIAQRLQSLGLTHSHAL